MGWKAFGRIKPNNHCFVSSCPKFCKIRQTSPMKMVDPGMTSPGFIILAGLGDDFLAVTLYFSFLIFETVMLIELKVTVKWLRELSESIQAEYLAECLDHSERPVRSRLASEGRVYWLLFRLFFFFLNKTLAPMNSHRNLATWGFSLSRGRWLWLSQCISFLLLLGGLN